MIRAVIQITLRPSILDPQGKAVAHAVSTLGVNGVQSVRMGKHVEVLFDGVTEEEARRATEEMCKKLLANPVMEDYTFTLEKCRVTQPPVRFGIVVFPGSNCDHDAYHVCRKVLGQDAVFLWHKDADLKDVDVVILPGGFSYGDYLRCGAIARFSPVMREVTRFAEDGGLVLGICNGFQILVEAGLLPGVLLRNASLRFACKTRADPRGERVHTVHVGLRPGRGADDPHRPRRRQLLRRRRNDPAARSERTGGIPVLFADRRDHGGKQPERVAGQYRRDRQRTGECPRA